MEISLCITTRRWGSTKVRQLGTAALLLWATLLFLPGCGTTKRLQEGEVLLRRNQIVIADGQRISREAMGERIRQQPNRRIAGLVPFYLWAYQVPNPDKADAHNEKRALRANRRNIKRVAKGKNAIEPRPWGSWWQNTVGEPPVVLDTALSRKSSEQLHTWLVKQGWFKNRVEATTVMRGRKKATVRYTVYPGIRYHIDSIEIRTIDAPLKRLLLQSLSDGPRIEPGDPFVVDRLDEERARLTTYFRERGYFRFNKELIYFDVDTVGRGAHAHLTLGIIPRRVPYPGDPDSLLALPHQQFTVEQVFITDRPPLRGVVPNASDTSTVRGYIHINNGFLGVKPRVLAQNVLVNPESTYNVDRVTRTYQRMSALPAVRSTALLFSPVNENDPEDTRLNCTVALTPAPRQNVSLEARGTNRGGFLGVAGTLTYSHRNIFGGAEQLNLNLIGGLEAQQLLTDAARNSEAVSLSAPRQIFNTLEFGPDVALTFPKFLLPSRAERFAKSAAPRTTIRANLSYQRRPDYERARSFGSISYQWLEGETKQWLVAPVEVSLISIDRSEAFTNQLIAIGDPFLLNSFSDHFILSSRLAFTYNNSRPGSQKSRAWHYRGDGESAGSVLRGMYRLFGVSPGESGSFTALGIRFAQYVKTTQELRYTRTYNEQMAMAYRLTGGVGVPYGNLNAMPFEKSFFGGGANDIRAWQARTLGPGSFRDPRRTFDKIGDILIEANSEYRFDLIDILEGALFADAGNIWNLRADPSRPGAEWNARRFISEIAIGAGVGFRLNFDFFLIRLDLGLQVRDPSLDPGERWLFQPKDRYNDFIDTVNMDRPGNPLPYYSWQWNLNLGIGYPF